MVVFKRLFKRLTQIRKVLFYFYPYPYFAVWGESYKTKWVSLHKYNHEVFLILSYSLQLIGNLAVMSKIFSHSAIFRNQTSNEYTFSSLTKDKTSEKVMILHYFFLSLAYFPDIKELKVHSFSLLRSRLSSI